VLQDGSVSSEALGGDNGSRIIMTYESYDMICVCVMGSRRVEC